MTKNIPTSNFLVIALCKSRQMIQKIAIPHLFGRCETCINHLERATTCLDSSLLINHEHV